MLKSIITIYVLFIASSMCAQQIVGTYKNLYINKQLNIRASEKDDVLPMLLIEIPTKDNKTCYLSMPTSKVPQFKSAMMLMRKHLFEWGGSDILNQIESNDKEMEDVKFPLVQIIWKLGEEYTHSYNNKLNIRYLKNKGTMCAIASDRVASNSNKYTTITYMFIFMNPYEIDELLNKIDEINFSK